MKKITTLVLSILFSFALQAQTYTPFPGVGAQWNIEAFDDSPPNSSCPSAIFTSYRLTHDTVINAMTYVNMHASGHGQYYINPNPNCQGIYDPFSYDAGAIRQDTVLKRVYIYDYLSQSENLLLDFNLTVGTPLYGHIYWGSFSQGVFHISSVDSVLLGSQYYRRYFFRDTVSFATCLYGDSSIIEGIGPTSGLFDFPVTLDWGGHLQCFSVNNFQIYPTYGGAPCTIFTGIEDAHAINPLRVFPNPATNEVLINGLSSAGKTEINIYNTLGEKILSKEIAEGEKEIKLNVKNLAAGIYVVRVNGEKTNWAGKFVKE